MIGELERTSSNLKSFVPLIKSMSRTQDSHRGSVALKDNYMKSMERLNEILQAKSEQTNMAARLSMYKVKIRKSFSFALTSSNPLPYNPSLYQKFVYSLRLPPHGLIGKWITCIFVLGIMYCAIYSIFKDKATPWPNCDDHTNNTSIKKDCLANMYGLFIIIAASMVVGSLFNLCRLPPLLGMLITGIIFSNISSLKVVKFISGKITPILRKLALVVILTRAGLCLDIKILRTLSAAVFRLAFIPCCIEATACAVASYLILGYDIAWGFTLGFVLGAVSPAIVVLSMLKLESEGYGVEKGIPTLIIAAASMDDVLAISGHSFAMGMALPSKQKTSTIWKLLKGPIEFIVGLLYGIIIGVLLWYFPNKNHNRLVLFRVILLLSGGVIALLGSKVHFINMPAGGAVGCLTLSFVAGMGWRERDGWIEHLNPIVPVVDTIWWIAQPSLFSLIGSEINFTVILNKGMWLFKGFGVMGIALLCRMMVSFACVFRTGLDFREMLFVPIAWIPKATVQAAIGPLAKDYVNTMDPLDNQEEQDKAVTIANDILILGCLSILLTAPIGALLIGLLGPKLLRKMNLDSSDSDIVSVKSSNSAHVEPNTAQSPYTILQTPNIDDPPDPLTKDRAEKL